MKYERKRAQIKAISESGRIEKEIGSTTVEANLLFDILVELKKMNKPIIIKEPVKLTQKKPVKVVIKKKVVKK